MSDVTSGVDPSVMAVDRALLYLRRRMTPRGMNRGAPPPEPEHQCDPSQMEFVPMLYAIANGGEVTVGKVAEWMCVDPSRASRMVAAAIEAGHVTRLASQADGRRSVLELTEVGREILAGSERYRQSYYQGVMSDWTDEERHEFARLLTRFADAFDRGD